METIRETKPSKHRRIDAHMNLQKLWQHAQNRHMSGPNGVPVLREEVKIGPNS